MTDQTVTIENAKLRFRNFSGKAEKYNPQGGKRNFTIFLEPEKADELRALGYNVKQLAQREEDDRPQDIIKVTVNYGKGRPPRCVLVTSKSRTELGADEVWSFDVVDIKQADILIRPYDWVVNDETGRSAYLKTAFITVEEDELEKKYADIPEGDYQTPPQPGEDDE